MFKLSVLILLVFGCFVGLKGQQIENTPTLSPNDITVADQKIENSLKIEQIQSYLEVNSLQDFSGFANHAFINQTGTNHKASLNQTGSGNEARLLAEGQLTDMSITQTGSNNSVFSNLSNNTTQIYSAVLQQKGSGNNIELTLLGNNVVPDIDRIVSVTQTGNDLSFTATYDSPEQPVSVEQTSGTGGAGMSVSISTSAFYFPMKQ